MDIDFKRGKPMTDMFKNITADLSDIDVTNGVGKLLSDEKPKHVDEAANFSGKSYIQIAKDVMKGNV